MKKGMLFTAILVAMLLWEGCTEEGIGGEASISGQISHHDEPIPGAAVYIKYGANELPGIQASDYDDQTLASPVDGSYGFDNLEKGSYYLFSKGYDSQIFDSVLGGIAVILEKGEALETNIPVTE